MQAIKVDTTTNQLKEPAAEVMLVDSIEPKVAGSSVTTKKRQQIPQFLSRLYSMIDDSGEVNLIKWINDGTSFEVIDKTKFTQIVLPRHFKHSNLNSFIRQLNMYDFHKVRRSNEEMQFHHPFFVKDQPELLVNIKRKTNSQFNATSVVQTASKKQGTTPTNPAKELKELKEAKNAKDFQTGNLQSHNGYLNLNWIKPEVNATSSLFPEVVFPPLLSNKALLTSSSTAALAAAKNLPFSQQIQPVQAAVPNSATLHHQEEVSLKKSIEPVSNQGLTINVVGGKRDATNALGSVPQATKTPTSLQDLRPQQSQPVLPGFDLFQNKNILVNQLQPQTTLAAPKTTTPPQQPKNLSQEIDLKQVAIQGVNGGQHPNLPIINGAMANHLHLIQQQMIGQGQNGPEQQTVTAKANSQLKSAEVQQNCAEVLIPQPNSNTPSAILHESRVIQQQSAILPQNPTTLNNASLVEKLLQQQSKGLAIGVGQGGVKGAQEKEEKSKENQSRHLEIAAKIDELEAAGHQGVDPGDSAPSQQNIFQLFNQMGLMEASSGHFDDQTLNFMIQLVYIQKYINEVSNLLLDLQAHIIQLSQGWTETLARFFYELKIQNQKRAKLATLFQIIVEEVTLYGTTTSGAEVSTALCLNGAENEKVSFMVEGQPADRQITSEKDGDMMLSNVKEIQRNASQQDKSIQKRLLSAIVPQTEQQSTQNVGHLQRNNTTQQQTQQLDKSSNIQATSKFGDSDKQIHLPPQTITTQQSQTPQTNNNYEMQQIKANSGKLQAGQNGGDQASKKQQNQRSNQQERESFNFTDHILNQLDSIGNVTNAEHITKELQMREQQLQEAFIVNQNLQNQLAINQKHLKETSDQQQSFLNSRDLQNQAMPAENKSLTEQKQAQLISKLSAVSPSNMTPKEQLFAYNQAVNNSNPSRSPSNPTKNNMNPSPLTLHQDTQALQQQVASLLSIDQLSAMVNLDPESRQQQLQNPPSISQTLLNQNQPNNPHKTMTSYLQQSTNSQQPQLQQQNLQNQLQLQSQAQNASHHTTTQSKVEQQIQNNEQNPRSTNSYQQNANSVQSTLLNTNLQQPHQQPTNHPNNVVNNGTNLQPQQQSGGPGPINHQNQSTTFLSPHHGPQLSPSLVAAAQQSSFTASHGQQQHLQSQQQVNQTSGGNLHPNSQTHTLQQFSQMHQQNGVGTGGNNNPTLTRQILLQNEQKYPEMVGNQNHNLFSGSLSQIQSLDQSGIVGIGGVGGIGLGTTNPVSINQHPQPASTSNLLWKPQPQPQQIGPTGPLQSTSLNPHQNNLQSNGNQIHNNQNGSTAQKSYFSNLNSQVVFDKNLHQPPNLNLVSNSNVNAQNNNSSNLLIQNASSSQELEHNQNLQHLSKIPSPEEGGGDQDNDTVPQQLNHNQLGNISTLNQLTQNQVNLNTLRNLQSQFQLYAGGDTSTPSQQPQQVQVQVHQNQFDPQISHLQHQHQTVNTNDSHQSQSHPLLLNASSVNHLFTQRQNNFQNGIHQFGGASLVAPAAHTHTHTHTTQHEMMNQQLGVVVGVGDHHQYANLANLRDTIQDEDQ